MIIDSHVLFWKFDSKKDNWISPDRKLLRQNYLPEQLEPTLKRNGVDGCIAVQATNAELETHFLVELAKTHPVIKGVVGWVDFRQEKVADRLSYFSQYRIIRGWRHNGSGDAESLLGDMKFQRGISSLRDHDHTVDLLVDARQLRPALDLVARFPAQKFILDHCGKPNIANREIDDWRGMIKELARHPAVSCKLSGLFTETEGKEWSPGDFYPYLDTVFEFFGTSRLVFGSDWPVMLLSGMYVQWKSLLEKYMENFSEKERKKVFGENAGSIYKLGL